MSRTEDVLGALQLLAAMYPLEGELQLSEGAKTALVAAESGEDFEPTGPIDVVVSVPIDDDSSRRIELAITLPLDADVQISIRQPRFLPRAEYAQLEQDLPQSEEAASDTIMSAIEYVRITAPGLADAVEERRAVPDPGAEEVDDGPLSRVWLWLPGLETREKTRDLVVYAPGFKLTGFVLAGKPGLICLEGGGKAIDRYMAVIKSESWGDVPSFQKKVSPRPYLEEGSQIRGSRGVISPATPTTFQADS